MTTEVLRNMVYADSPELDSLKWVVLDEVHFLQDPYRGPVWEEVLIHCPAHVRFVCLSATVSNSGELGEWITALRGPTTTVLEHRRPVELDPLYLVGDRSSDHDHLVPLLVDGVNNPEGDKFDAAPNTVRHQRGGPRRRFHTPRRLEVLDRLESEGLLPAIYFIFSRNGCSEAAQQALDAGVRLTEPEERSRIRTIVEEHTAMLDDRDLDVLNYDRFLAAMEMGVAPHHAGMVPAFREAVEQCFVEGYIKMVFATETLALGINMPARSVVIERLSKFNGEGHEVLSPGQFTQLTGRAGRRGIDDHGSAVVLWSPFQTFDQVATLAASREFPLISAFRPTYNMVANLVDRTDRESAEHVLSLSFAQFQTDKAVVGLRRSADRIITELDALPIITDLPVSEVDEYIVLMEEVRRLKRHRRGGAAEIQSALSSLRPGDVVERITENGRRLLVIISVSHRKGGAVKVRAVTARGSEVSIDVDNAGGPLVPVALVTLPVPFAPADPKFRAEAAARLRKVNIKKNRAERRREASSVEYDSALIAMESHPLHNRRDREDLLSGSKVRRRLSMELERAERRIAQRGSDLAARLTSTLEVMEQTGHSSGWHLTEAGQRLRRVYHECDLLISLALTDGLLDGLSPAEVAGIASCFTYEHRSSEPPPPPSLPTKELRNRFKRLERLSGSLGRVESSSSMPVSRAPDAGFADVAHAWASGRPLDSVVDEDLTGGDFVRNIKQLIDLLTQLSELCQTIETRSSCQRAVEALRRGVVTAGGGPT